MALDVLDALWQGAVTELLQRLGTVFISIIIGIVLGLTGAATVILAMGAGRKAARAIDEYVKSL